jgi:hypothetical protein
VIGSGAAAREPQEFGAALREAGHLLSGLAEGGDQRDIAVGLLAIAARLEVMGGTTPARGPVAVPEPVRVSVPEQISVEVEPEVVSIESLAYEQAPSPVPQEAAIDLGAAVPIAALAPDARLPFERAFDTYRELRGRELAPHDVPAHAAAGTVEAAEVDIRAICYSGRSALERANEVRAELAARLSDGLACVDVEPLLRELLDLVPLAMEPGH